MPGILQMGHSYTLAPADYHWIDKQEEDAVEISLTLIRRHLFQEWSSPIEVAQQEYTPLHCHLQLLK